MSNQLPTDYQSFIHKSRYAKYHEGTGRESWDDTVTRYSVNIIRDLVDPETKYKLIILYQLAKELLTSP